MAIGYLWASVGLCALLFVLALDIMGVFSRKNHFEVEGRVSSCVILDEQPANVTNRLS